ncbi:hypothetical protein KDD30_20575 (plasmid) [Photobacterium sp. GJ3]|uniref:hypothetical protein n=1 Tax=Photobacterium sp. GJ3 TaxID=2829502 RepID=UPI001B8AF283|nr:hypothetical protein [Photobacterium sp. GJ3]QUJ70490.1 hypothetical protein KDD30_20575 [Photobacterium sp. GJ3]
MADTPNTQTWYSGDWKRRANTSAPYNGVQITGTPQYDDNGTFISVAVAVTDYTLNPNGVSSLIQALTVAQGKLKIPVPDAATQENSGSQTTPNSHSSAQNPDNTTADTEAVKDESVTEPTQNNTDTNSDTNAATPVQPTPDPDFTVNGWISLEMNFSQIHLRVHFQYGQEYKQREELGYIMGFRALLTETD